MAGVLAILLAPSGASATHLTATGSPGGPTVPWGFNEDWGWSNGAFSGAEMANLHMQKAGAIMPDSLSANRFHVEWAYVEKVPGTYDWSMSDAQYAAMQKYTPRPIMLLDRAPVWARDPAATCARGDAELCMYPPLPQFDSDWKAFVQAAVKRYPKVRAIEVWNEPNIATFWSPAADPTRYAAVLKAAHDGVRAAGSSAPVLTGGLYPANTNGGNVSASEFLDGVYATAGAGAFEGIGSHPYPHQAPYVDRMWTRLDALRAVRDQYGDSATPLWITEVGISTEATTGVPLDQQADVLAQLYHSIEGHDVRSFVIHRLHDVGSDYWGQYGVLNQDLTPKPAYCELGAAIGTACDTDPPETSITSGPSGPTNDSTPTFGFSSDEPGSSFECRFDADPFGPCSGPGDTHTPAAPLADGPHTFEVQATDPANNTDPSPASSSFTVDTSPPRSGPGATPPTCNGSQATIVGTKGNDVRSGTPGKDVIVGLGGNDKLSGLAGNDLICGGAGKDTLNGGKGNDKLYGESGKDILKGGPGKDVFKGGAGKDKQVQ